MKVIFFILKLSLLYPFYLDANPLIDAKWLSKNVCKEEIKVIEVGTSYNSYLVEHINCSQFTNFYKDGWRTNLNRANMVLPNTDKIISLVNKLGIYNSDHIVLYAKKNEEYSVAETTAIYFTLKHIGHKKTSFLNGGYPEFKKKYSLLVEEGKHPIIKETNYKHIINNTILATTNNVIKNNEKNWPLVDARETDFYLGINKLRNFSDFGTIKKSKNIPSKWFLEGRGLRFNDIDKIKKIYNTKKIYNKKNIIYFCNAGLESSLNWFVDHELLGNSSAKLYEGSIFKWVSENKNLSY